jgi:hypothetical protein
MEFAKCIDAVSSPEPQQALAEIEEYDSLAILNLLSVYDQIGAPVSPDQIKQASTVEDLVRLAGDALSDG